MEAEDLVGWNYVIHLLVANLSPELSINLQWDVPLISVIPHPLKRRRYQYNIREYGIGA